MALSTYFLEMSFTSIEALSNRLNALVGYIFQSGIPPANSFPSCPVITFTALTKLWKTQLIDFSEKKNIFVIILPLRLNYLGDSSGDTQVFGQER